jgi:protein subunit release factor B
MGKYSGKASPAEFVAGLLRPRGIEVDPYRLEEQAAADRSRRKLDEKQDLDEVRAKATMVKRARRETELAEFRWRRQPNSQTLQEAQSAQRARTAVEAELLEALSFDKSLMRDVLRQA